MKVLIVGEGGREHALAWKTAQSEQVEQVFVAPGNAGTAGEHKTRNLDIAVDDIQALLDFSLEEQIDLCIVGPEVPLVMGIADRFSDAGIRCFGPRQAAAQLEGSKAFAKQFLQRHSIATAAYAEFSELQPAVEYVKQQGTPIVIKADGLAAGKGVIIAQTEAQAIETLQDILEHSAFGGAGASVVIEAFLEGEEASFICMVGAGRVLPLASSQDHKAAYEGDTGPNTGGMGAYTPAPVVDTRMYQKIMQQIIHPTLRGLEQDGLPYTGFLYAGVMIDDQGEPSVLEFNCRMGDPETQPIMMRLESDLASLCVAAIDGNLPEAADWREEVALGVVLAAEGYPGRYEKGRPISIDASISQLQGVKVFHAGTRQQQGELLSNGGRVLCVCSLGDTTRDAQQRVYEAIKFIEWDGMWYRKDIGHRAIAREPS